VSSRREIARPEDPVTLPLNGDPIPTDTPIEQGAELQTPRMVQPEVAVGNQAGGFFQRRLGLHDQIRGSAGAPAPCPRASVAQIMTGSIRRSRRAHPLPS
jgi:hypothetical protein